MLRNKRPSFQAFILLIAYPAVALSILSSLVLFWAATPTLALTLEQARENCRNTVGRPIVQSCMRQRLGGGGGRGFGGGGGGGGNGRPEDLEACRAQATPRVQQCVKQALNAANGRANVAAPIPTERGQASQASGSQPTLPADFVAPPRTIVDITTLLDGEKPDPARIQEFKVRADSTPPSGASREQLARYYYDRGNARAALGRLSDSIHDANKAVEVGKGAVDVNLLGRLQQFQALRYLAAGDPKRALATFQQQLRDTDSLGGRGYVFNSNRNIVQILLRLGELTQAEAILRQSEARIVEARTSGLPGWRQNYPLRGQAWEADVELTKAILLEARGRFREAEASFRITEQRRRASVGLSLKVLNPAPVQQIEETADKMIFAQARMKARQGQLVEAEAVARRGLLSRLKAFGKYHPAMPEYLKELGDILVEQGRYKEAETLTVAALEINRTIGSAGDSISTAQGLSDLGAILALQGKAGEARAVYSELDRAVANWEPQRRQVLELNSARIFSLYTSNNVEAGISAAQALLKRELGRVGEKHFDTAVARGTLAIGYMRAGRIAEALQQFKTAVPTLLFAAQESALDDDSAVVAARTERLKDVIESYIGLLAQGQSGTSADLTSETFRLSDVVRGQSVQRALNSSVIRMAADDTALATVMRNEQNLEKQINAALGLLVNVLSLPSDQRSDRVVEQINAQVVQLRRQREAARTEIARRFPRYADLNQPKAPTIEEARAALRGGETLVSFYFGRERSFVWVVPKEGPAAFRVIAASGAEVESKIATLRKALEPDVASIDKIPAFDLGLASDLYELLLKPVESSWKQAKALIVVTNGALGLLPLSLLPTSRTDLKSDAEPWFAAYRDVPWLARTHAVTLVPSAAALKTLRQLPSGSTSREALIGFGDPFFSEDQATEAQQQTAGAAADIQLRRRALPKTDQIDSAELARLPRLPDTSDELKAVATALGANGANSLHLGKAANERAVKNTDLTRYRIVAFATHGLLPGDLNGLTQPALAMTAPKVAGIEGDGLLSMEEILALKLDADWVVLSACNTGAGTSSGAEALSGLGRAFFYAGTRSLLITNWSVDSVSARELVVDLFRRQSADPKLSRGEALRQAMMALVETGGYSEDGKTLYSYAHPLFWAPYSIIGEGGGLN